MMGLSQITLKKLLPFTIPVVWFLLLSIVTFLFQNCNSALHLVASGIFKHHEWQCSLNTLEENLFFDAVA